MVENKNKSVCVGIMLVIGQCHTCVCGQYVSCGHAVVVHFPKLSVVLLQKHFTDV